MTTNPPVHVACAADENYVPHCATMLLSLLQHNPGAVVHFLYGPDLRQSVLDRLAAFVGEQGGDFRAHCLPESSISELPGMWRIPPIMWYRVYLPELLPDVARVLYLDCDTIVRENLQSLWQTPMDDAYVAAVDNVPERVHEPWVESLGLERYFNSGVLLFNLDNMRRDAMTGKLVQLGRERRDSLRWPDQDALNLCLGSARVVLHPRWNSQGSLFYFAEARRYFSEQEIAEATTQPAILHFEGDAVVKPWHILCKHPWRQAYLNCRQQTPWPLLRYQGQSLSGRLLRMLPPRGIWRMLGYRQRVIAGLKKLGLPV